MPKVQPPVPSTESWDDDTPPAVSVPETSLLQQVQTRLEMRIDRMGARFGSHIEKLQKTTDEHEKTRIEMFGRDNDNGKFSLMRKEISGFKKMLIGVAIPAIVSLGGWVSQIYAKGQADGRLEQTIRNHEETIKELSAELIQVRIEFSRPRGTRQPLGDPP